jgi:hypothetical protein
MPNPDKIELYSYNVFFGDCFLLVFHYPDGDEKFVLIDFGSTGKGHNKHDEEDEPLPEVNLLDEESTGQRLLRVAQHIQERCKNGRLDVVVATHRHKDHIYGFGLKKAGQIIMDCNPRIIIQPWTEHPDDNRVISRKTILDPEEFKADKNKNFAASLLDMGDVAAAIEDEIRSLGAGDHPVKSIDYNLRDRIIFAADDNQIKNRAAVENLQKMGVPEGSKCHYVNYGYTDIDWNDVLPGVKVRILGPPSLDQSDEITSATNTSSEFWSLQAIGKYFWGMQAATSRLTSENLSVDDDKERRRNLFSPDKVMNDYVPPNVRWIIGRLRNLRADQLLQIVQFVDNALNNTSVIMHFETGDQKMLFPGDAQIENWRYALAEAEKDPNLKSLLRGTTLYKVGHHGSRNATPKTLWKDFQKRSDGAFEANTLKTVVSTMRGKHGESEDTEVPLPVMVAEMKKKSEYHSTEELKAGEFYDFIEIEIK